jgi:hypothetical protein
MGDRKSPTESATLYKVNTKKKGNDGNTWIVSENKNGIKRWKKYKANALNTEKSRKKLSVLDYYDVPKIKKHDWLKWEEELSTKEKLFIEKVRSSYKEIENETSVHVVECILPISNSGVYWIDYVWDYTKLIYPKMFDEKTPLLIVVIKLNKDMHLNIKINNKTQILCQHNDITDQNKFFDYMKKFNKTKNGIIEWTVKLNKTINFVLDN